MIPARIRQLLAAIISLVVVVAFVALHGTCAAQTMLAKAMPVFWSQPAVEYIANALTGIVSGVMAAAFGIPRPTDAAQPHVQLRASDTSANTTRVRDGLVRLSQLLHVGGQTANQTMIMPQLRTMMAVVYVVSYILVGGLALIALVAGNAPIPPFTKSLAMVTFGIALAVANSFMIDDRQTP